MFFCVKGGKSEYSEKFGTDKNQQKNSTHIWLCLHTVNKLMSLFHASALLLIIAVDPQGDSQLDPQTTLKYFGNVMMECIVNNRTDELKADINLIFMVTNCQVFHSRSLIHSINSCFCPLFDNEN